jgi:hypothetical protein
LSTEYVPQLKFAMQADQSQEPPGFGLRRFYRLADIALALASKKGIGIDSRVVAIAPFELQSIPADRFDILQHDQHRHIIRLESQFARPFIRASGTRTMLSQEPDRIDALMPVIPGDPKEPLLDPLHISRF